MLLIAEGKPWPAASELTWDALLKMLGRDDFIKRVLALKPVPLSLQPPSLLEQISFDYIIVTRLYCDTVCLTRDFPFVVFSQISCVSFLQSQPCFLAF